MSIPAMAHTLPGGFAAAFPDRVGERPRLFFSPGRVNLIGEHTDYNGGAVFPCAIQLGTYGAVLPRPDGAVRLESQGFSPGFVLDINDLAHDPTHGWANYPKAVAQLLLHAGHKLGGFDLYICSDLPGGAGLSSSASVNMLVAQALCGLFGPDLSPLDKVLLCQRAENEILGVNCGIMDPFAIGMAREGHGMMLHCASMEYTQVPLALGEYALVMGNTHKARTLADSKYNQRRAECEAALADLQTVHPHATALCHITVEQFKAHQHVIKDETARRRAQHAIYEHARTHLAVMQLQSGSAMGMGMLMNDSHISLRDLYEVTGPELDALVQAAWDFGAQHSGPGPAAFSRMTGAGFGGCTISLVRQDAVDAFIQQVGTAYTAATGLVADFYPVQPGAGARELGAS